MLEEVQFQSEEVKHLVYHMYGYLKGTVESYLNRKQSHYDFTQSIMGNWLEGQIIAFSDVIDWMLEEGLIYFQPILTPEQMITYCLRYNQKIQAIRIYKDNHPGVTLWEAYEAINNWTARPGRG